MKIWISLHQDKNKYFKENSHLTEDLHNVMNHVSTFQINRQMSVYKIYKI